MNEIEFSQGKFKNVEFIMSELLKKAKRCKLKPACHKDLRKKHKKDEYEFGKRRKDPDDAPTPTSTTWLALHGDRQS
jgi:hypothetical protein